MARPQRLKIPERLSNHIISTGKGQSINNKQVLRTPALRALAKELKNTPEAKEFMNELPHKYFDENQLHAFLISQMKDVNQCFIEIEKFLPYVDNWATCDQMNPKVIGKYPDELYQKILVWIKSDRTYTVRFAIRI